MFYSLKKAIVLCSVSFHLTYGNCQNTVYVKIGINTRTKIKLQRPVSELILHLSHNSPHITFADYSQLYSVILDAQMWKVFALIIEAFHAISQNNLLIRISFCLFRTVVSILMMREIEYAEDMCFHSWNKNDLRQKKKKHQLSWPSVSRNKI